MEIKFATRVKVNVHDLYFIRKLGATYTFIGNNNSYFTYKDTEIDIFIERGDFQVLKEGINPGDIVIHNFEEVIYMPENKMGNVGLKSKDKSKCYSRIRPSEFVRMIEGRQLVITDKPVVKEFFPIF